jgi:drug/metabolite transporter (DMT)-like permease
MFKSIQNKESKESKEKNYSQDTNKLRQGYLLGIFAVFLFSMTVPVTKIAVADFPALFLSSGRGLVACILAALYMLYTKQKLLPPRAFLLNIFLTGMCVVIIFPVSISFAMTYTNPSHGAVVLGILPLTTAIASTFITKQKLQFGFWICAALGSLVVIIFSMYHAKGQFNIADIYLLIAIAATSFGYVKGAQLTKILSGMQVISWALLTVAPIVFLIFCFNIPPYAVITQASTPSWLAFVYMSLISQYLGFIPWYKGLSLGGIAEVSQVQLLQPLFSLIISACLHLEVLNIQVFCVCILVMCIVYIGKKQA